MALLHIFAAALLGADISGYRKFSVESDAGSGSPSFVFKQDGEKLTGTYTGQFGTAPLKGSVKGNNIEFAIDLEGGGQQMKIVYKGTIDGAAMKGEVAFGDMAKGTWTGKRE